MNKIWSDDAWEDYVGWQTEDKKTLKRINLLLKDVERHPFDGIGKTTAQGRARRVLEQQN